MNGEDAPLLSILFADVAGNALLHEKLGSSEARRSVERCLKRMQRSVDVFAGRLLKTQGQELMAVFDNPDVALQAAIDMRQRVADLPPVSGLKLAVRIGFCHAQATLDDATASGEAVRFAAYLAGLARPSQILTEAASRTALSDKLQAQTRDAGSAPAQGRFPLLRLFEQIDPTLPASADAAADPSLAPHGPRLLLRYAGEVLVIDERQNGINLGRDAASDLVIMGRKVSRHHARIELRGAHFFLIDKSTNGTFLNLEGKPEKFLHGHAQLLRGRGIIGLAASASLEDTDCVEFECL